MKSKPRRRTGPDEFRKAMAGIPKLIHKNEGQSCPELLQEMRLAHRRLVLSRSRLTADDWKTLRTRKGDSLEVARCFARFAESVFEEMDPRVVRNWCLPHQCDFEFHSTKSIRIKWRKITSSDVHGSTLYHWPERPTIPFNGARYVAGFSVHTLLRVIERFDATSNYGLLNIGRLLDCSIVEPVGSEGFWIWIRADQFAFSSRIVGIATGTETPKNYLFRACYCPVSFRGKFAYVHTALHPAQTVKGINDRLVTFNKLGTKSEAVWNEYFRLHEHLPQFRLALNSDRFWATNALASDPVFKSGRGRIVDELKEWSSAFSM
ncbi:hypothetical protein [Rhodopirellula sp. SWK7]|uniref:hypothetical protein n=1 Tax=Rhodopirellula sp. SWK7 TaxID=595460 RepID=UPI0002BFECF8|nr:hypothetical protein [Rhodopirellula sp. SWK7]EMI40541.1 hypothetical protein RRSWK_06950 [Rhodopirellula sp. SWK7]